MDSKIANFIKNWWPLVTAFAAGLVGYGSLASDVTHMKKQQDAQISDHDRIVRMETTQQLMAEDVSEIKRDIKELAKAVKE